jgi:DegV family protein with EDD domain
MIEGLPISVVPMWLTVGGRPVRDGEVSLEQVAAGLGDGVNTSGPSPGEIAEAADRADSGDGAAVLTIAQAMSGTYDAAVLAASQADSSRRIRVVDTQTAAGAQGLVVLAAARCAASGASLDEVEAIAHRVRDAVRLVATLPSLDQLARGGRVPGAAAWAGRWLGVNPMFEFRAGRVRPLRPALSRSAACDRILAAWRSGATPGASLHAAVMHALDPQGARDLLAAIREQVEPATAFIGSFSPVMVAHTGAGLLGLAWWWDASRPG